MASEVIKKFVDRFNISDQSMGSMSYLDFTSNASNLYAPINGEAKEFYSCVKLEDTPTIGGDFYLQLFTADEIENAQSGWTGPDDETLPWKKSFVLFGDRNGDAVVFDSAQPLSPVYGSIQKRSFLISTSFFSFLEALIIGIDVEEVEFSGDTREEDLSFKKNFLKKVEERLNVLGDAIDVEGFMKLFFM